MIKTFSLALAILLSVAGRCAQLPEKLRILSCDLGSQTSEKISNELKTFFDKADPDIIFLQGATDWESCDRICKLRPGLRVLTCSGFAGSQGQVAILARDKAILSWVEETSGGNGFAFALVQAGPRKLGVFSARTTDASRVLAEVKKVQQFANNRPNAFLIGGFALSKAAMVEAGFETVASDAKEAASEFWASNAGFLSRPRSISIPGIRQPVLVTDIDTASSFSSKFAYQTALLFPGETPAPVQAVLQAPPITERFGPILLGVALTLGTLIAGALFLTRRRKPSLALVPVSGPQDDLARASLLGWLKTVFVQRLLSQRQQMIANETEATRRTLVIEEKLTQLQSALQDRVAAYENRIERLETELSAATSENRELIRSQIDLLKEKVAKAKEEFTFRRN